MAPPTWGGFFFSLNCSIISILCPLSRFFPAFFSTTPPFPLKEPFHFSNNPVTECIFLPPADPRSMRSLRSSPSTTYFLFFLIPLVFLFFLSPPRLVHSNLPYTFLLNLITFPRLMLLGESSPLGYVPARSFLPPLSLMSAADLFSCGGLLRIPRWSPWFFFFSE